MALAGQIHYGWQVWSSLTAAAQSSRCRRCDRDLTGQARFCPHCGLRLRPPGAPISAYRETLERGRRLRGLGKPWYRVAIWCFQDARSRRPGDVEPLLEIARTYRAAGHPRRARRWYRRAVRMRRDCYEAWAEGATCFAQHAHFRRLRWLRRAILLRPADPVVLRELTWDLARLGGWQRWWAERWLWRLCSENVLTGREGLC